jgi:hypothetical protein
VDIVQIAWGTTPGQGTEVIAKSVALRRAAEALEVHGYEPGWAPWDLAAAFGLRRPKDSRRFKWYMFTPPRGEVLCVSRDGETYWVQDGSTVEFRCLNS